MSSSRTYTAYSESEDMTFILFESVTAGVKRIECRGFYFGEPNEETTNECYGKLSAVIESEPESEPVKYQPPINPYERARARVYATGNRWAIENFNATH